MATAVIFLHLALPAIGGNLFHGCLVSISRNLSIYTGS
jgi:hypothetical protein